MVKHPCEEDDRSVRIDVEVELGGGFILPGFIAPPSG
jgi:hypothetical protein